MKLTLRLLGIAGLLGALFLFPIYLERPPMAEIRRVVDEETKSGAITDPARSRLEAAVTHDTERTRRSFRVREDHALWLDGLVAVSSAVCLVLSMRKGRWVSDSEGSSRPNL